MKGAESEEGEGGLPVGFGKGRDEERRGLVPHLRNRSHFTFCHETKVPSGDKTTTTTTTNKQTQVVVPRVRHFLHPVFPPMGYFLHVSFVPQVLAGGHESRVE